MATKNDEVELISYDGKSFMGISKASSVFIDFTERRKPKGFVELMGKHGIKKTSTLWGIAYALGAELPLEKARLFNSLDKGLDEDILYKKGKEEFKIEVRSSRINLKKKVGDDKWRDVDEDTPAAMIRKTFGPVGLFPVHVKEMKGRKQIEYFQELFGSGEDASKKMAKLESEYDTKYQKRTGINSQVTLLKGALEVDPLFQNYEKSSTKYAKPINADKEEKKYKELADKKNAYEKYVNTVELAKADVADKDNRIADLEKELAKIKAERAAMQTKVDTGEKWLKEQKGILQEFATADEEWLNLSKTISEQNRWTEILKKEKQMIEKQEESSTLTEELKDLTDKILKATNEALPKVKGLVARVATGIDKTKQPEGMFYVVPGKKEEQPLHQLSETEYADMWCQIWETEDMQLIFIENMTSFGDSMVNTLNQFVKNGGTVFYTIMNREIEELTISFKDKID